MPVFFALVCSRFVCSCSFCLNRQAKLNEGNRHTTEAAAHSSSTVQWNGREREACHHDGSRRRHFLTCHAYTMFHPKFQINYSKKVDGEKIRQIERLLHFGLCSRFSHLCMRALNWIAHAHYLLVRHQQISLAIVDYAYRVSRTETVASAGGKFIIEKPPSRQRKLNVGI